MANAPLVLMFAGNRTLVLGVLNSTNAHTLGNVERPSFLSYVINTAIKFTILLPTKGKSRILNSIIKVQLQCGADVIKTINYPTSQDTLNFDRRQNYPAYQRYPIPAVTRYIHAIEFSISVLPL